MWKENRTVVAVETTTQVLMETSNSNQTEKTKEAMKRFKEKERREADSRSRAYEWGRQGTGICVKNKGERSETTIPFESCFTSSQTQTAWRRLYSSSVCSYAHTTARVIVTDDMFYKQTQAVRVEKMQRLSQFSV